MKKDNVVAFSKPEAFQDALTTMLRQGARTLIQQAIEAELSTFLSSCAPLADGRVSVARNGFAPQREVLTGLGPIAVKLPKTRDRAGEGRVFRSSLVPRYVRKAASVEAVLPWLYLAGISSDGMQEALHALLGEQAKGLSDSTIGRLKEGWQQELDQFAKVDLTKDQWVYLWCDGIYTGLRGDGGKVCALVVIGVNERGQKRLLAMRAGQRESELSWREVFTDLKLRGVKAPKLIIGDGAAGLWSAAEKIFPKTQHQRCWVHKTANVLNKLPKHKQPEAKRHLQAIWGADTKANAAKELARFVGIYGEKYAAASATLTKDKDQLLAFFDFPAAQWKSLRTTNPIESTFATVRHRTDRCKGAFTERTVMALMFKLIQAAEKTWQRIAGFDYLAKVISGVRFADGVEISHTNTPQTQSYAA
jgi:putative transposase